MFRISQYMQEIANPTPLGAKRNPPGPVGIFVRPSTRVVVRSEEQERRSVRTEGAQDVDERRGVGIMCGDVREGVLRHARTMLLQPPREELPTSGMPAGRVGPRSEPAELDEVLPGTLTIEGPVVRLGGPRGRGRRRVRGRCRRGSSRSTGASHCQPRPEDHARRPEPPWPHFRTSWSRWAPAHR